MAFFKQAADNSNLNRQFNAAKKRKPDVPFEGPDGEYTACLAKARLNEEKQLAFLDYLIQDEGKWQGVTATNVYALAHDFGWDNLFSSCRIMGIDVDALKDDPSKLDAALDKVILNKVLLKVSITSRGDYKNIKPLSSEAPQSPAKALTAKEDPVEEEWGEELQEDSETSYVGAVCNYAEEQFVVDTHDEETGMLDLADMDDPDTIWYLKIPVADVEFVLEE